MPTKCRDKRISKIHDPWCGYWYTKSAPGNGGSTPSPTDNYYQQSVDPYTDDYVTAAAIGHDLLGVLFLEQEIATETNTELNYIGAFPKPIGWLIITKVSDKEPCARRETSGFQYVTVKAETSNNSFCIIIDTWRSGAKAGTYIASEFVVANDEFNLSAAGNWSEGYVTGEVICVYAWNSEFTSTIKVLRSDNFGINWSDSEVYSQDVFLESGETIWNDAPCMAKGQDGNLYICWLTRVYNGFGQIVRGELNILVSTNKGVSWTYRSVDSNITNTVSQSSGYSICASATTIYIAVAKRINIGTSYLTIYRSTNSGVSWTTFDTNDIGVLYAQIACNDDNIVLAADYQNENAMFLYSSDDGGETWTQRYNFAAFEYSTWHIVRSESTLFVYTACSFHTTDQELAYLFSDDNGVTWSLKSLQIGYTPLV